MKVVIIERRLSELCPSPADVSPICLLSKPTEGLQSNDHHENLSSPTSTQFDFSAANLEQREDDQEPFR